jgi:hypothetical protein
LPGSIGTAVPQIADAITFPSRFTSTPALAVILSLISFGSSAASFSCATFSRSPWPAAFASAATSRKPTHALAVRPAFSWQSARLKSVPMPGSRFWLSASLGQA